MSLRFGIHVILPWLLLPLAVAPAVAAVATREILQMHLDEVFKAVEPLFDALNAVYKHVLGQGSWKLPRFKVRLHSWHGEKLINL